MVFYPDFLDGPLRPEERRPLPSRGQSVNAASNRNPTAIFALVIERFWKVTTMRAVLFVLIVIVLAVIAGISTGFLNIDQIRGARAPEVAATSNGLTAKGGQAPAFDVETGSVKLGTRQAVVKVPTLVVQKPGQNQAAAATNNSM
jgi:hypothetical protein